MGSELYDTRARRVIWGLGDMSWYVRAWTTGAGLADLQLTEAEQGGTYDRVRPVQFLEFPAFFRTFGGLGPYTKLMAMVSGAVAHQAAVLDFPYDWRLPVRHNGGLLAAAARRHLDRWRRHPAHERARRHHPDGRPAQLVFIAHSMGGLLVRQAHQEFTPLDDIRATITLGTPFYGAVKATALLNTGRGAPFPLPARRPLTAVLRPDADAGLAALAHSLPGVHDLLPTYRCLIDGDTARSLGPAEVEALGGDRRLAADSLAWHASVADVGLRGHRAVIGIEQPTAQSLRLAGGVVTVDERMYAGQSAGVSRPGDGTVYRDGAALKAAAVSEFAQQHAALAKTDSVLRKVRATLTEHDPDHFGPPMGAGELSLAVTDVVTPLETVTARVGGIDKPDDAVCRVEDAATGVTRRVGLVRRDGAIEADITLPAPGLYRVEVDGNGSAPTVDQFVLAIDPTLGAAS
ncbi:hypothetical protein AB0K00_51810 [Dactylosporangium sp. NPDC049525]|uniref:esterase/lipase family protein n=1 Tax=Dactylosporangium sp. NPDC049525 TaxID=3154730 RepID=UPI00341D8270